MDTLTKRLTAVQKIQKVDYSGARNHIFSPIKSRPLPALLATELHFISSDLLNSNIIITMHWFNCLSIFVFVLKFNNCVVMLGIKHDLDHFYVLVNIIK